MSDLTERQREYLDALPQPSYQSWVTSYHTCHWGGY